MLAFLKRWRQAYLEDKGNRLHAEVEESLDILNKYNVLEPEKVLSRVHQAKEKDVTKAYTGTDTECMTKGYYY
ncbi:TPA: hypothetical protein ACVU4T_003309 [Vibrio parahaemolyticus]